MLRALGNALRIRRRISGAVRHSVPRARVIRPDASPKKNQRGVKHESIVIDPGIGFGKSQEQNLELIARLDQLARAFPDLPILIGTSRKSFIGKMLANAPASERVHGTMASVTAAILNGVHIVRVHDVKAAVETVRLADAIIRARVKS